MEINRSSLFAKHELVRRKYFPIGQQEVFYHYTSEEGLKGILNSGGLYANYRGNMSDTAEFTYARNLYENSLNNIAAMSEISDTLRGFAKNLLLNMELIWDYSKEHSNAYCTCLTSRRDDYNAWNDHSDRRRGYCVGFHLHKFLWEKRWEVLANKPFFYCLPINYDPNAPYNFIAELLNDTYYWFHALYQQMQPTTDTFHSIAEDLLKDIFAQMYSYVDFFKSPEFEWERELRFMQDPNNGQLLAANIRHLDPSRQKPFLFFDLRLSSGLIPITEIFIGPNNERSDSLDFVRSILSENGYLSEIPIIRSSSNLSSDIVSR